MITGQWIGEDRGTNPGSAWVELDPVADRAIGTGLLMEQDPESPWSLIYIDIPNDLTSQHIKCPIHPIHPENGYVMSNEELRPELRLAESADIAVSFSNENEMKIEWSTQLPSHGSATLRKYQVGQTSRYNADPSIKNFGDVSQLITHPDSPEVLFRGQAQDWPLQTKFHRTKRTCLDSYIGKDLGELSDILETSLAVDFDRRDPRQNTAIMALAQHHGYPTPLLDWSRSPYIALFFALQGFIGNKDSEATVSLFKFDAEKFTKTQQGVNAFSLTRPTVTIANPARRSNPRLAAQQGVLTFTNLRDVEDYILYLQNRDGTEYMKRYDIDIPSTRLALHHLRAMGISSAAMLGGLDASFKDLADQRC